MPSPTSEFCIVRDPSAVEASTREGESAWPIREDLARLVLGGSLPAPPVIGAGSTWDVTEGLSVMVTCNDRTHDPRDAEFALMNAHGKLACVPHAVAHAALAAHALLKTLERAVANVVNDPAGPHPALRGCDVEALRRDCDRIADYAMRLAAVVEPDEHPAVLRDPGDGLRVERTPTAPRVTALRSA